jgi:hypothetical protein
MIISKGAYEENEDFKYSQEVIQQAQEKIKEFPILYDILRDFSGANQDNYSENYFLMLSAHATSDPFLKNEPNLQSQAKLHNLNVLLQLILPTLKKDIKTKILARLKGFDEEHYKTILELELYIDLIRRDVSNLEYENPERGTHDFYFIIDNDEFNIELTSLGRGKIQEMLENAFKKTCETILAEMPEKTLLKFHVQTDKLLEESGNNDEGIISTKLYQDFKILEELIYITRNNYCFVETNLGNSEKSLFDCLDIMVYFGEFGERVLKLIQTEEGQEYLEKIKIQDLIRHSFKSFMIYDATTKIVEIDSECSWPSKAESLRKKSMLKQLKNRLSDKLELGQLKNKKNPILALYFRDTIMHDYTSDTDYFGQQNLNELVKIIDNLFEEKKDKEILGVILIEKTLAEAKFIPNKNITINGEVMQKIISLFRKVE